MAAFPAAPLPAVTELLISGAWTDFTSRVCDTDQDPGVEITRGRSSESQHVQPSRLSLTLDNRDGALSNRMPTATYYGLLGRNTQLRQRLRWIQATFTSSVSSAWPAADTGQVWTNTGGAASDFSSSGGTGRHLHTSVNVFRQSTIDTGCTDMDITVDCQLVIGSAPNGDAGFWICVRSTDLSNHYAARLLLDASSDVRLGLIKRVGGVLTGIDTGAIVINAAHTGSEWYTVRVSVRGGRIRATAWIRGATPPTQWLHDVAADDAALNVSTGTKAACMSRLESGNTNTLPVTFFWDNFEYNDFRFWGEVSAWPPVSDVSGSYVTVPIEAAGIMRRLGTSGKPLRSALTRAISASSVVPSAYWPCEDSADGLALTKAVSPIAGVSPMIALGASNFASTDGAPGSDVQPSFSAGGSLVGVVPGSGAVSSWRVQAVWKANTIPVGDFAVPLSWVTADGKAWELDLNPGVLAFSETVAFTSPTAAATVDDGLWHEGRVTAVQNGGNIDIKVYFDGVQVIAESIAGTVSRVRKVQANAAASASGILAGIGHFAVWNGSTSTPGLDTVASMRGYVGETAAARMTRLCSENGVPFGVIGTASDTAAMGPQRIGKLLDLLFECADADQGILFEPRDSLGLTYRTRTSLYNQTGPTLTYSSGQVAPPFAPTEDDQLVVNDATARRTNGGFARVTADTGTLSTLAPPNGVGTYDEDRTFNVYLDSQLEPIAGWRTHLGTWDEFRFPAVAANLARLYMDSQNTLAGQAAAVDIGDYLSVANPPAWLPPDLIELLAQGYRETHRNYQWDITWNCVPAGPYKVFVLDSATLGRLDGDHALVSAVNSSDTSWSVMTRSGPVMTTVDADDGWQWMIEGELVTVTDVAPSTISFVSAGTASTGSSGPRTPGLPSSVASGDLVLIFASTRNIGGVPDTPANWFRYPVFEAASNAQVFGRIYDGVWTMPTVTFTGGIGGQDTIAQSMALRGKFNAVAQTYVASAGCLNAVAQDIITPGVPVNQLPDDLAAVYLGWKQDDWTSVATPASWTEAQEAVSVASAQAAQVWGYRFFTSAPAAGSLQPALVVTGGAAAISQGGVLVLRSDKQTVTVTRSVNQVSKSHAAGAVPRLLPAPHLAL